jgi:Uncharacterized protein conserved in bacteria
MTMITPSYLGETIEYSSLHACRSTLEDPTGQWVWLNDLAVIASLLLLYTGFLKWLHHRRRRRHPSGRRSSPQARHK